MSLIRKAYISLMLIQSQSDIERAENAQEALDATFRNPWSDRDTLCRALKECCSANDALVKKDPSLFRQYRGFSKNNIEMVRALLFKRKFECIRSADECSKASKAFFDAYAQQKKNGPEIVQLKTALFEKIDKYKVAISKYLPKERALLEINGLDNLKYSIACNCNSIENSGLSLQMLPRTAFDGLLNNKINTILIIGFLYTLWIVNSYASIFNEISNLVDGGSSQFSGQSFSAGLV